MARVVRGRTPYAKGESKYEAFRPDQRQYNNPQQLSGFQRLLQIMKVAETIGKSPLSGLLVQGVQKLAEGAQPTLTQAAAARKGAPVPGQPQAPQPAAETTIDEQAAQFVKQATSQPAQTTMSPARMTVKPTQQMEKTADTSQKNIEEFRARAYRSPVEYAPSDVARILQTSGISGIDDRVFQQVIAMVADKQRREGPMTMEDIESIAVRVSSGQPFGAEETESVEVARREAGQRRNQARFNELMSEKKAKEELIDRMEELPPKLRTRMRMLIRNESPVAIQDFLSALRARRGQSFFGEEVATKGRMAVPQVEGEEQLYDVMADYLRLMKGVNVPDYNAEVAARNEAVAIPQDPSRPAQTTEVEDLVTLRRGEAERSREAATAALEQPAVPSMADQIPTGKPLEFGAEQIDKIVSAAMAKPQPIPEPQPDTSAAVTPEQPAEAPVTPAAVEETVETETVEVATQPPAVRRLVAGAEPQAAKDFNQLFANARRAVTAADQAAVLDQVANVRLPARSFFDFMFDGPQQRARAELLKAFPRGGKPRTQSQQLADLALAELRQAQAKRATTQATEVEPARAEGMRAKAAVSREKAEARSQDKSITQSIIDKNLAMAQRALRAPRFRGSGNTAKRMRNTEIENARRAAEREIKARYSTKDIDAEQNKLTTQIQRLQAAAKGNVANPGKAPAAPEQKRGEGRRAFDQRKTAYNKEKASFLKRESEYKKDQNRKKQVSNTIKTLGKRQAKLNNERRSRQKTQTSALRKLNNDADKLKGGASATLRSQLETRRKSEEEEQLKGK